MAEKSVVIRSGNGNWVKWKASLEELFRTAFNRDISNEYLNWRYVTEGESGYFAVFGEVDDLLASYSVAPVRLFCNSNEYRTAISMTTMTHPIARGKGIFPKLAEDVYQRIATDGICMVWGFMNDLSHRIFIRDLNWYDIYEIPTMILDLEAKVHSLTLESRRIVRDDLFQLKYHPIDLGSSIRVERTNDFLAWRYLDNPINDYKNYVIEIDGAVISYIVVKEYLDGLDLVDIQVTSENDAIELLNHIIQSGSNEGKRQISCWMSVHHFVHGLLEKIGFKNAGPITYFGGLALQEEGTPKGWRSFSNWYIQMGDSDVF